MTVIIRSLVVAALVCSSVCGCKEQKGQKEQSTSLKVGSTAPALEVSRWVKGEGITKFEPGQVYVVEFWATWCPPCRTSIPHITEMAQTYKGKVSFIGVSVFEQGEDLENKVDSFVRDMGDKMDYLVARDTTANVMSKNWLVAAGINGIPSAFIVDGSGKIAWIGHPMEEMDKAIDKVLADSNSNSKSVVSQSATEEQVQQIPSKTGDVENKKK